MKFCNISPTLFIPIVAPYNRCWLSLAHLVESSPEYVQAHLDNYHIERPPTNWFISTEREIVKIMDNSAFEMYKQGKPMFPPEKLVDLGKKIAADYIVMSDYPGEVWTKTRDAAIALAPSIRNAGMGTFFVPQAEIGNLHGLIESFSWACDAKEVDYIGVSILAVPNAFGVEKNNNLQRYLSRWAFMRLLAKNNLLQIAKANKKKIHFLGMFDGPNELMLLDEAIHYGLIDSWDSSSAAWHGALGIKYDQSPTGLINGKNETEVDFNFTTKDKQTVDNIMWNVHYINNIIEGCK